MARTFPGSRVHVSLEAYLQLTVFPGPTLCLLSFSKHFDIYFYSGIGALLLDSKGGVTVEIKCHLLCQKDESWHEERFPGLDCRVRLIFGDDINKLSGLIESVKQMFYSGFVEGYAIVISSLKSFHPLEYCSIGVGLGSVCQHGWKSWEISLITWCIIIIAGKPEGKALDLTVHLCLNLHRWSWALG